MHTTRGTTLASLLLLLPAFLSVAEVPTEAEARTALRRAVRFFREQVAAEGGYLWQYSADLSLREGEGRAEPTTIWVQPPGTPSVGMAMLRAYERTGEEVCRQGAVDAARALVQGQLTTGGWNYRIEFDPKDRKRWHYRTGPAPGSKARNTSVLDDDNTQAALRLLMRVDRALEFKDTVIHDTAMTGLGAVLKAQFESGGWPQVFDESQDPSVCPPRPASFPDAWSRTYQGHQQYWYRPTLNDNVLADVMDTLLEAADVYGESCYREAALRGGEFLLRAQLPEPQPGWAQQYSLDMQPIWARKFEPPAVTGGESRGVLQMLMELYELTADDKWLEPIPRALAYYRRSVLPDGKLARFYELRTNRPLYFTRTYELTYDDRDMPTHYAFKQENWVEGMQRRYDRLATAAGGGERALPRAAATPLPGQAPADPERSPSPGDARPILGSTRPRPDQVRAVIAGLDDRGAWVEQGELRNHPTPEDGRIIACARFIRNLGLLADYIAGLP